MILNSLLSRAKKMTLLIGSTLIIVSCGGGETSSSTPQQPVNSVSIVTANIPTNNDSKVPTNQSEISVDFSKQIDPNSVNNNTFTLSNGITGTVTTTNNNTRAVFTPIGALSSNLTYTVTLNGITDSLGNAIFVNNQPYTWSFTTCGTIPASTYTVNWSAVSDNDLSGYRLYYGTTSPLTKANSTMVSLGTVTSWNLNPSNLGFQPCNKVEVAVSTTGSTKSESSLSSIQTVTID